MHDGARGRRESCFRPGKEGGEQEQDEYCDEGYEHDLCPLQRVLQYGEDI